MRSIGIGAGGFALLLLLLSTVVAAIVSVPLTVGFVVWSAATLVALAKLASPQAIIGHRLLLYLAASSVLALAVGLLGEGAGPVLIPCGAAFFLTTMSAYLSRRSSAE